MFYSINRFFTPNSNHYLLNTWFISILDTELSFEIILSLSKSIDWKWGFRRGSATKLIPSYFLLRCTFRNVTFQGVYLINIS